MKTRMRLRRRDISARPKPKDDLTPGQLRDLEEQDRAIQERFGGIRPKSGQVTDNEELLEVGWREFSEAV